MTTRLRKILLTTHIATSVSWIGAAAAFLVLAISGLSAVQQDKIRMCYVAMDMIAWYAILPLSLTALSIGILQSLLSPWGLFRHNWVVAKLALTVFATVILVTKMPLIRQLAELAEKNLLGNPAHRPGQIELLVHSAGGLVLLITITALSVFKPWGKFNLTQ
jgi:hypothetical protein